MNGEYVLLEYNFGPACVARGCESHREVARPVDSGWVAVSGQVFRADFITVVSQCPVYLVSLDAAVEAAAKADYEAEPFHSLPWEETSFQEHHRSRVRPLVAEAVMGGAQ